MLRDVQVYFIRICIISLCNTIYLTDAGSVIWNPNIGNITRYKRQTNCRATEFRCNSGDCISEENECDGKEDCADGSDETNCSAIRCHNFFQCKYGACIRKDFVCDGKKDCRDNSDETSPPCNKTVDITTREGCPAKNYQCRSGECINEEKLCDGTVNCMDGSDETKQECSGIVCQPSFFRCTYGACLNKKVHCNGIKDCADGSDEIIRCNKTLTPTVTPTPKPSTISPPTPTRSPNPRSCLIPEHPQNGKYSIGGLSAGSYKPGDYTEEFSGLIIECNPLYHPNPPQKGGFPLCINKKWSMPLPECSRSCPEIKSSLTTKVTCTYESRPMESCDKPIEGTIANLQCEPLYEEPGILNNPFRICRDGTWDYSIPQCFPICGEKRPLGKPNLIGGDIAKYGDYPWHIGIYMANKEQICGGSLINQRVVLSAAHCFTDYDGNFHPKENYLVAAGKYYREYSDPRDTGAQYSDIDKLYKHERYRGVINNFEADVAIVILKEKLRITPSVQPVCVDWQNNFEYQQLQENNVGLVVGWGYTSEGSTPSEELKELYVPYISYSQCFEHVPKQFQKYITHDKVCAGYLSENKSACQGDSGGGLTFEWTQNRYYIRGIVSTSPTSKISGITSCNANQYGTYTLISKYIKLISDLAVRYRV